LWRRQLVGVGIGLVVMFLTTLHDYRRIVNAAPYLYGVGVVLLLLVLTPLGKERRKSMDEILVNAATSPLPPAITSRRCGLDRTEASPKRR
jgi:cell division protein FtsW (lipid II flippase)